MSLFFPGMLKFLKRWYRLSILVFLMTLSLSAFWTLSTNAHANANHFAVAHLRIEHNEVRITLALPASLVRFADDNGNSQLSSQEIATHQLELQNFFSQRLRLTDSEEREGKVTVKNTEKLSLPPFLLSVDTYSTVLLTYTWQKPVIKLKIDYDLFDNLSQGYYNLPQAYYLTTIW